MTNPRDTGRYDAFTDSYVDQQVQIDFAWGNIPMQPNDDRGMAQLDPELDSHIIATTQYEGFPAFTPGAPFDDTIPNVEVPNLVGLVDPTAAQDALEAVDLVLGDTNSSTAGATSGNDLHVKTQSIAAGTLVNVGSTVDIVVYDYVAPVGGPIAGFNKTVTDEGWTLGVGDAIMYLSGRTVKPTTGDVIRVSGSSESDYNHGYNVMGVVNNDSYNTGGTAVWVSPFEHALTANTSSGGTWAPYN